MKYGTLLALSGAARGLNTGLDELQEQRRYDQQTRRQERQDARSDEALQMDRESHQQGTRLREMQIDEGQAAAEHSQLTRKLDDAMREFIGSGGTSYGGLVETYNTLDPDGGTVNMTGSPKEGYTLDFGDGRVMRNMTAEQVVGLAANMKDPDRYLKHKEAENERKIKKQDLIETEDRQHGRAKELRRIPAAGAPTLKVADDGTMYSISGGQMQRVSGPAGGLTPTFKGDGSKRTGVAGLVDYLVDNNIAKTPAEAFDMANQAKQNPQATAARLAEAEYKAAVAAKKIGGEQPPSLETYYANWLTRLGAKPQGAANPDDPLGILQ